MTEETVEPNNAIDTEKIENEEAEEKKSFLIDMDGVLIHGTNLIPGAEAFIEQLEKQARKYLIVTNNPLYTTRDLAHRLQTIGLNILEENIYTSALATASFLQSQRPREPLS